MLARWWEGAGQSDGGGGPRADKRPIRLSAGPGPCLPLWKPTPSPLLVSSCMIQKYQIACSFPACVHLPPCLPCLCYLPSRLTPPCLLRFRAGTTSPLEVSLTDPHCGLEPSLPCSPHSLSSILVLGTLFLNILVPSPIWVLRRQESPMIYLSPASSTNPVYSRCSISSDGCLDRSVLTSFPAFLGNAENQGDYSPQSCTF